MEGKKSIPKYARSFCFVEKFVRLVSALADTYMHTHISIWKEGRPLFAGDKYAGLSDEALWAIGIFKRFPASAVALRQNRIPAKYRLNPE